MEHSVGLRIGVVARCLNTAHIRGMGTYVFELLRQSQSHADLSWHLFADDTRQPMVVPPGGRIQADVFEFRGDRFHLWEQIGLPLRTLKRSVDVLHCTEGTLPLWQPKPTVVTLHDTLSWDEHAPGKVETAYFDRVLPAAMHKSAAIVTISQSSKNDILNRWPGLEPKLSVIPHGIASEYFIEEPPALPASLKAQIETSPYVIYLGGPLQRKRFDWALNVMAHCKHPEVKLIACGFGYEARDHASRNLLAELQDKVYFASFLSDSELRALYRGAQAVLYPTLYEGFGFPVVEAQAAGVPVIFSALGSLAELIGPLAMVVPPFDLDAWLAALTEALSLGEARVEKSRSAKTWARNFSWAESLEKHLAVYRAAALAR